MISLIILVLCPFLFFVIFKKVGWKLFLASFSVFILFSVIYFNKVNIVESFNCLYRKPVKPEHIYDYILWRGEDGKLEISKIFVLKNFCDSKENLKEVLDFYKKMPKVDSVIYVKFIKNNDYYNSYVDYHFSYYDSNDLEYINNLTLISFSKYNSSIAKNTVFLCKTYDILDYDFLEKDTVSCNINMKYKEINRETLQIILNTLEKISFQTKSQKYTYSIQNSVKKQTEVIVKYKDFGKKIELEIF